MTGLGPIRLPLRGLRLAPGVSALIAILVLAAALLSAGAPRQTSAALTTALHEDLASSAGALALSTDVTGGTSYDPNSLGDVTASLWPTLAHQLSGIRKRLAGISDVVEPAEFVGNAKGSGNGFAGSGTPTTPKTISDPSFTVEATPSLQREARLVTGRWPRAAAASGPTEVVIAAKTASVLNWRLGQSQSLAGTDGRSVVLVGTVAPRDASSAFWSLDFGRSQLRPVVTPLGAVFYFSTIWVDAKSWPTIAPTLSGLDVSAWFPIDTEAIGADEAPTIAAAVRKFVALPGGGFTFASGLPSALVDFTARSGPSTALIALFELGPAGALAAVLFLGLRLLQSRRSTVDVLVRARGASGVQLRALAAAEIAVWTIPAAIVGGVVAIVVTPGQGSPLAAIVAIILSAIVAPLVAAALAEAGGSRDAAPAIVRAARPVAEIAVVAIAVLVLATLIARGPVTATSGVDPLVELAPLLLAVAVTVLIVRVLPFGIRATSALLQRGRGAVSLVASSSIGLARRGGAAALFALVVGAGMSVFSLTMVATQQQGVEQAALSQVGSDIAVTGTDLSGASVRSLEALPGVAASATVQTIGEQSLPQSNVTVYTVDPKALASVQSGIHDSLLSPVSGTVTVVSGLTRPPMTSTLGVTGTKVLRLDTISGGAVSLVFSDPGWMLMDRATLPSKGVFPVTVGVLLRVRADADPARVAAAAKRAAGSGATVHTAAKAESVIIGSPIDRAVQSTILVATTLAALLCLAVFVMTLAAGAADRLRRGAILRALGFGRGQTAALVLVDVVPIAVVGVVVGGLTGIGLAGVVLHTIDPAAFVGAAVPLPLVVNIPTTALVLGGFLAAAALAALIAVLLDLARPAISGLQTLGEER